MNPRIKVKSITNENLMKKFAISYIFMSLMPIIFILFIVYLLKMSSTLQTHFPYFNLTVLLMVLLSLACFDLVRRSMKGLEQFATQAKEIAGGDYHKRIEVDEKDNEVSALAESFNKITLELQVKIREIELSKALLLDILQRIGTAFASTKGMENLLELIIRTLLQGTDATSGAIFLLDETKDQLTMKVSFGMDKAVRNIQLDTGGSLIVSVASSRRLRNISEVSKDPACTFEFSNNMAMDSMVAIPLLYKEDQVMGVLVVSDKKNKNSFNDDDTILLTNVTGQTAVAIKNFQLNEDADKTYLETITALAVAVEAKDPYSKGHLYRVEDYVDRLAISLRLDGQTKKLLRSGAILHDIGKIGIRDDILRKPSSLTAEEEKEMREHVVIGVNIIKPIRSMVALCDLVRHHQEFYDGSGYPDNLKGEKIPLEARILKICDAYDAMTTDRLHSKGMSKEQAKKELKDKSGIEFDPKIVEEFLKII